MTFICLMMYTPMKWRTEASFVYCRAQAFPCLLQAQKPRSSASLSAASLVSTVPAYHSSRGFIPIRIRAVLCLFAEADWSLTHSLGSKIMMNWFMNLFGVAMSNLVKKKPSRIFYAVVDYR
jgi:hypothetical protein